MNFLTADVAIKVDDSKLPSQLSKAKSAVTKTVDRIKSSFRRMATSFKDAFDKMVRYAKWGAVAVTGALTLATKAAMKQEDAVFLLGASLKAAGEYSRGAMRDFTDFAASIQQVTTYGDEEVLMLMQLEKSLGVSTDKLKEATRTAIGLAAATGRDVNSMAMYVAMAQQGEFTMLRRYIPALRTTTDKTKQLQILTEFAARGFEIAKARADTTSGALKQMKNAIGDVAEVIGAALLPSVKSAAIAIKNWAQENQQQIGYWAHRLVAYLGFAKDIFKDFISFMKSDFRKSWKLVWDLFVQTMYLALREIVTLSIAAGKGIWQGIKEGLIPKTSDVTAILKKYQELGGKLGVAGGKKIYIPEPAPKGPLISLHSAVRVARVNEQLWAQAEQALKQEAIAKKTEQIIAGLGSVMAQHVARYSATVKALLSKSDIDISKSQEKLVNRLQALESEYHPSMWQKLKQYALDTLESLKNKVETYQVALYKLRTQSQEPLNETTQSFLDTLETEKQTLWMTGEAYQHARAMIEALDAAKQQYGETSEKFMKVQSQINQKLKELESAKRLREMFEGIGQSAADAFSKMVFGAERASQVLRSLLQDIVRIQMQKMVTEPLAVSIGGWLSGMFGPKPTTAAVPKAQTGGFVAEGGLAKIHTGETILPAGRNTPEVTVNIVNESGVPLGVTSSRRRYMNMRDAIIDIVVNDVSHYGRSRKAIESVFERG